MLVLVPKYLRTKKTRVLVKDRESRLLSASSHRRREQKKKYRVLARCVSVFARSVSAFQTLQASNCPGCTATSPIGFNFILRVWMPEIHAAAAQICR